jgi:hypothetical protein
VRRKKRGLLTARPADLRMTFFSSLGSWKQQHLQALLQNALFSTSSSCFSLYISRSSPSPSHQEEPSFLDSLTFYVFAVFDTIRINRHGLDECASGKICYHFGIADHITQLFIFFLKAGQFFQHY